MRAHPAALRGSWLLLLALLLARALAVKQDEQTKAAADPEVDFDYLTLTRCQSLDCRRRQRQLRVRRGSRKLQMPAFLPAGRGRRPSANWTPAASPPSECAVWSDGKWLCRCRKHRRWC